MAQVLPLDNGSVFNLDTKSFYGPVGQDGKRPKITEPPPEMTTQVQKLLGAKPETPIQGERPPQANVGPTQPQSQPNVGGETAREHMRELIDPAYGKEPPTPAEMAFNVATMLIPGASVLGGAKMIPELLMEKGAGPALMRMTLQAGSGLLTGSFFGKPIEGMTSALTGAGLNEVGTYLGNYGKYFSQDGAKGLVKRFANKLSEITGNPFTFEKGVEVKGGMGKAKESFYDGVYKPLKDQVSSLWHPDGEESRVIESLGEKGNTSILPKRLADIYQERINLRSQIKQGALKFEIEEKQLGEKLQQGMQQAKQGAQQLKGMTQGSQAFQQAQQQQEALVKQLSQLKSKLDETQLDHQIIQDTLQKHLLRERQIPHVTFEEMEEVSGNLRNYGWGGTGSPRLGPMSAEERSAHHALGQEMQEILTARDPKIDPKTGKSDLVESFSRSRHHAHAWETMKRMVEEAEYTTERFGAYTPSRLQKKYNGYEDDMKSMLGDDYFEALTKTLFHGRSTPDKLSKEYGEIGLKAHAGGNIGTYFHGLLTPPGLTGPPMKADINYLLKHGIVAGEAQRALFQNKGEEE